MAETIAREFVPIKIHVKEQPQMFERFGATWTPTQILLDADGVEHHRIEGFLPVDDLLAQLQLGLGKIAFQKKDFDDAERRFRQTCDRYPDTGAGPEACYWAGVSAYKKTNDPRHLKETATAMQQRFPGTEWARKASVWEPGQPDQRSRAA